ncbi:type II toxin-antitoxin system HicB family antitoxin [Candidatus Binatus soli]|jgi:predicted RNase H-like HicB family nuclease|uniref:type II toxin-antitoxin system HicB family antitoxin n=1 Tax=Candidatus Binatus soli TaxID=1953413 RepID=UPI003D1369BE
MKQTGKMVISRKSEAKAYLQLPYARILIPAEEGGFTAEILEFPGCFAEGETPDEAFRNLESVAEEWIEATLEQGQEIPPPSASHPYAGRIALRLSRDLHRLAVRKAERDGISLNQSLVTAIATWVGADNFYERMMRNFQVNFIQANFIQYGVDEPESVTEAGPKEMAALLRGSVIGMMKQGAIWVK